MKSLFFLGAFLLLLLIPYTGVDAAVIRSTETGGTWSSTTTWEGGIVPSEGDDVYLRGPVTVNHDLVIGCLLIDGGASLRNPYTVYYTVEIQGDIKNEGDITGRIYLRLAGSLLGSGVYQPSYLTFYGSRTRRQMVSLPEMSVSFETDVIFEQDYLSLKRISIPRLHKQSVSLSGDGEIVVESISGELRSDSTLHLIGEIGRDGYSIDSTIHAPMVILGGKHRLARDVEYVIDELVIEEGAELTYFYPRTGPATTKILLFGNLTNRGLVAQKVTVWIHGNLLNEGIIDQEASVVLMWPQDDTPTYLFELYDEFSGETLSLPLTQNFFVRDTRDLLVPAITVTERLLSGRRVRWRYRISEESWSQWFFLDGSKTRLWEQEEDFFSIDYVSFVEHPSKVLVRVTSTDETFSGMVQVHTSFGEVVPSIISVDGPLSEVVLAIDGRFSQNQIQLSFQEKYGRSNIFRIKTDGSLVGSLVGLTEGSQKGERISLQPYGSGEAVEQSVVASDGTFTFSDITCGEYELRGEGESQFYERVTVPCGGTGFHQVKLTGSCSLSGTTPILLVPGILGSTVKGSVSVYPELPVEPPSWNSGILKLHNVVIGSGAVNGFPIFDAVGWEKIKTQLELLGYESGCTLFDVPYFWTRDAEFNAEYYLKHYIDYAKEMSGSSQVDIIAHSMGGIVTRAYLQGPDYEDDIRRVAFVGTPQEGSPIAYLIWELGDSIGADLATANSILAHLKPSYLFYTNTIAKLATNWIGMDNLCVSVTPGQSEAWAFSEILGCNQQRLKWFVREYAPSLRDLLPTYNPMKLDAELKPVVYQENSLLEELNDRVQSIVDTIVFGDFVGVGKKTVVGLVVDASNRLLNKVVDYGGDGTVPKKSSVFSKSTFLYEGTQSHGGLPKYFVGELVDFVTRD